MLPSRTASFQRQGRVMELRPAKPQKSELTLESKCGLQYIRKSCSTPCAIFPDSGFQCVISAAYDYDTV
jgi:hypothetical protein